MTRDRRETKLSSESLGSSKLGKDEDEVERKYVEKVIFVSKISKGGRKKVERRIWGSEKVFLQVLDVLCRHFSFFH